MKKIIINAAIVLLFMTGIAVMLYPTISNWYNQKMQDKLIRSYDSAAVNFTEEEKTEELLASQEYNDGLLGNAVLRDPFDAEAEKRQDAEYNARLNLDGSGIMGYIEIPKIDVNLVIYHGTSAEVLDKGVGHLENTSLPIGGVASHAVLSAHTAYSKAVLFNRLTELVEGDVFYITVMDDILAYQVDQIKVVLPTETGDLAINRSEDYVTLVTCTPYSVNTHRLLVRGTRIPYQEASAQEAQQNNRWWLYILIAVIILLVIGIVWVIKRKIR